MYFTRAHNEKIVGKCFKSRKRNPKPMTSCRGSLGCGPWGQGILSLCWSPKPRLMAYERTIFLGGIPASSREWEA